MFLHHIYNIAYLANYVLIIIPLIVNKLGRKQPGKYLKQFKTTFLIEIRSVIDKIVKFTSKNTNVKIIIYCILAKIYFT